MSHFLITRKSDANHKEIVAELEKRGVCVVDLAASGSGVTDLATYFRGQTVFVELKFGKTAKLKKTQVKFLSEWKGRCGIACTADEAYRLATESDDYCLTPVQKDRLAAFYVRMTGKAVHLNTILKILEM